MTACETCDGTGLLFVGDEHNSVCHVCAGSGRQPAEPTRRLTPADGGKPHRYVPAAATDVRATFEKFRRLQRLREAAHHG
jgi:hypothetical protein